MKNPIYFTIFETKAEYCIYLKENNPSPISMHYNVIHDGKHKSVSKIILNKEQDNVHSIDDLFKFLNNNFSILGDITDEVYSFSKIIDNNDNIEKIVTSHNKLMVEAESEGCETVNDGYKYVDSVISKFVKDGYFFEEFYEYGIKKIFNDDSKIDLGYELLDKSEYDDIDDYEFINSVNYDN